MLYDAEVIQKDEQVNKILSQMWELNNKIAAGEPLTEDQAKFFANNRKLMLGYYGKHYIYWKAVNQAIDENTHY